MEIRNETIDKIMAFLTMQQWNKVERLIHEINDQVVAQQEPEKKQKSLEKVL